MANNKPATEAKEVKDDVKRNEDGLEAGALVSQADHAKALLKMRKNTPVVDTQAETLALIAKALGTQAK